MIAKSEVKYTIQRLDSELGQMIVKYYTDTFTDGVTISLDLEIHNGMAPTLGQLNEFIMFNAPMIQLSDAIIIMKAQDQRRSLLAGIDLSHIQELVPPEPTVELSETVQPTVTGAKTL